MSGEHFEGEDVGYVPENMEFPQNHSDEHDEGDVIDESGVPQLQHDDDDDDDDDEDDEHVGGFGEDDKQVGGFGEDANLPDNQFDDNDVENLSEIANAIAEAFPQDYVTDAFPQEHATEDQHDGGDVTENIGSPEKQVPVEDSKGIEIKKWPGWPGENVFRMLVPAQKVGSIIGRKGEIIKKITEETRARVKVLDGPHGTAERAVMVSAKEEPDRPIPPAVEGFLRVHKQVVDVNRDPADTASGAGRPGVTRLLVADTQAGSLIGKQGATIKTIQDATGCNIRILGSEHLPIFALRDDSIVEIQGEPAEVHKTVELIALHLRKFLVDRSIVGVFETQMQRPDVRVNQNLPPHQPWGPPPHGFPAPGGGSGPVFPPNPQYMPPPHNYDNYYPPADLPPIDTHMHQGLPPAHSRDAFLGIHSSSGQPQQSGGSKVTQHMQIPLSFADAVIGASGANISYIRRASGASITIQETRGMPGEMTVEISGTASQIQAAQQLVQNFMAEAANVAAAAATAQEHAEGSINQGYNPYPANAEGSINQGYNSYPANAEGSINQGYNSYPTNAQVYAAPPSSAAGHAPSAADYGPAYGTNYGY